MWSFLRGRLIFVRLCLLAAALALVAVGIATIYSVGHPSDPSPAKQTGELELAGYWKKQLVFAAIALIAFLAANIVSYRRFGPLSYWIYAFVLMLLVLLLVSRFVVAITFIPEINGTHRWIRFEIGGRQLPAIQPSEFCKLAYVLALAWYLRYRSNYRSFKALVGPFILTILPMVLIFAEPDLRTVLLMMPILFIMLFIAGARTKHLLLIAFAALLLSPFLWLKMRPYQRTRISCVLLQSSWIREKAQSDSFFWRFIGRVLVGRDFSDKQWKNDWGYHLIRSKFAVASGGPSGYGFRQGPFIKYNFLPERHNDFIFAVIAHQWGFWGCLAVLGLYVILIAAGLEIAASNTDPYGRLIAVGIVVTFTVEVIVNVAMTIGLMPITGLTLPFISYGGSSLLVSMASVGVLNNVGRFRPFTVAPKK
jgi:cell division protein FtsW (lipid II flippase)